MFSREFRDFLVELLTSWQVIVAAVVVVLYVALVNYVTHFKTGSRQPKVAKQKVKKVKVPIKKKKKEKNEEDDTREEKK